VKPPAPVAVEQPEPDLESTAAIAATLPLPPPEPPPVPGPTGEPGRAGRSPRLLLGLWWAAVLVGVVTVLVCGLTDFGLPEHTTDRVSRGGAALTATAYTVALAVRTGGRPWIFGGVAALLGGLTVVVDVDVLTTGVAVMAAVVTAVLSVMLTVPAVTIRLAAREALVALGFSLVGAVAVVGFEPTIALLRFEYAALALSLAFALSLVFRLGAGLHGLGRRGVVIVVVGSVVLALTLAYAELLRRYGTPGLVDSAIDGVRWSRAHLSAFPRPIVTVLGVPALAWGCHMRARRRQGWWVSVFGVAATAPVATSLLNTVITLRETVLANLYATIIGLLIGALLIRIDVQVTAPKGRRGRRGRRAEAATAIRPEPPRSQPLL
jgi:hypothetical protein